MSLSFFVCMWVGLSFVLYISHLMCPHSDVVFEPYDLILYEKMSLVPEFKRKTLILIGPPFIGRRQLKDRLVEDAQDKYAQVTARECIFLGNVS